MSLSSFEDILQPRRQEASNFLWASRTLNPKLAWIKCHKATPQFHKDEVLKSPKIQQFIRSLSISQNVTLESLEAEVRKILDEIGYEKNIKVIRWLGMVLVKICVRTLSGLYVNTQSIRELKSRIGNCPVIFVPSHRSYADFILMSYVCFNEDLAVPAIAAGMDFHKMWGMGNMLRKTGAFFIRRSYNDDNLYWTTFKQYINQIVTKGDLPIEFFIEGTRSRSNKSLTPKYGLILMILKAYFLAQVPDIWFVPINISYDRILEEKLFAFEHLGVPKPKESTSGFFKSLGIVKEKYGSIYVDFAKPISIREFIGSGSRSAHNLRSIHQQEVTEAERKLIPGLSYEIIHQQQKHSVLTTFNLISMILNDHLCNSEKAVGLNKLSDEIVWLKEILEELGAKVDITNINTNIGEALNVHKSLVVLNDEKEITLVDYEVTGNLTGPNLKFDTVGKSLPFIMLQIYVNPVLHYLIDLCLVVMSLKNSKHSSQGHFYQCFELLKSLFSCEFVSFSENWKQDFDKVVLKAIQLKVLKQNEDLYELGENVKLQDFLCAIMTSFTYTYYVTCCILESVASNIQERKLLSLVQSKIEENIAKEHFFIHPYCLSMEVISNCLNSLNNMKAVNRRKGENGAVCEIYRNKLIEIRCQLEKYLLPECIQNGRPYLNNKL